MILYLPATISLGVDFGAFIVLVTETSLEGLTGATLTAELDSIRIISIAFWAFNGQCLPLAWLEEAYQGIVGCVNQRLTDG
jgi:hypothetical protein